MADLFEGMGGSYVIGANGARERKEFTIDILEVPTTEAIVNDILKDVEFPNPPLLQLTPKRCK